MFSEFRCAHLIVDNPYLTDLVGTTSCVLAANDKSTGFGSDRLSKKSNPLCFTIIQIFNCTPTLTAGDCVGDT